MILIKKSWTKSWDQVLDQVLFLDQVLHQVLVLEAGLSGREGGHSFLGREYTQYSYLGIKRMAV